MRKRMEEDKAAVKIQARWRGNKARKDLGVKKEDGGKKKKGLLKPPPGRQQPTPTQKRRPEGKKKPQNNNNPKNNKINNNNKNTNKSKDKRPKANPTTKKKAVSPTPPPKETKDEVMGGIKDLGELKRGGEEGTVHTIAPPPKMLDKEKEKKAKAAAKVVQVGWGCVASGPYHPLPTLPS